jgi:hypothetical protein
MESLCDTVANLSWGWQLVMAGTVLFLWKEVTMGVCTCSTPLHAQVSQGNELSRGPHELVKTLSFKGTQA